MRILIVGFGVIGEAFARHLEARRRQIFREHGLVPRLVGVVDEFGAAVSESGLELDALLAAKKKGTVAEVPGHGERGLKGAQVIAESDADVVVEATPSMVSAPQAAMEHLKSAFRTGKHAITVNKAPLAVAMPALLELAAFNRVQLRFSGTVGGGTPVLDLAKNCARGDEVLRVRAILNGTTNFILSRMHDLGEEFDAALAEAVKLGYAETDPSADIDGIDTACKVVIFANWVMGRSATLSDLSLQGIRGIPRERIEAAAKAGKRVKLIGEISERLVVEPQEVEAGSPLDVGENLNAVTVSLREGKDVTLVGRGAGGPETATSILRDLIDIWQVMGGT